MFFEFLKLFLILCSLSPLLHMRCYRFFLMITSIISLTTVMLRQSTSVTRVTMLVRGFDTSPARVTVTVGPPILAGTRATRVAVNIGHVPPHVTLDTVLVLWTG